MTRIDIQFTLFSAFYSPLIATMAGGFLTEEGLEADWSVAPPGSSAIAALREGAAHVVQSAPSQAFAPLSKGEDPGVVHFAQINEMDGFFLTGRAPDPNFDWRKLEGAEVVLFGGGQPLAMFKYACHKAGIDYGRLKAIHPGNASEIDRAFRDGVGQYVQQQGPFPQQLEADGIGHVVAQVGRQVGRCGFSSLCARPDWLETHMARAFARAYRKARLWLNETPARRGRPRRAALLSGDRTAGTRTLHRCIPATRLLDAAYRDHPRSLRGIARYLCLQRPNLRALRLRAGLCTAAGGLAQKPRHGRSRECLADRLKFGLAGAAPLAFYSSHPTGRPPRPMN